MVISTNDFLEFITNGINNIVEFRMLGKDKPTVQLTGTYDNLKNQIDTLNQQGYDCYFVVNSGGRTDISINKINAVFIDYDCPKTNNEYSPLEVVEEYKSEKLDLLNDLSLQPSIIIETRNGLHVYWLLDEGATIEQFKQCQIALIKYFDSDPMIKNPSRILRLPNTHWMKDINNPFLIKALEFNDNRYCINEILEEFEVSGEEVLSLGVTNSSKVLDSILLVTPKLPHNSQTLNPIRPLEIIRQSEIVTAFKNRDSEYLKEIYKMDKVVVSNNQEYMNYILSIDLRSLLGIESKGGFCCIFHDDSSPSASIFQANETKHFLYKCHSVSCGVSYNILNIIEKLGKYKSRAKAHDFIRAILNVSIEQSEWQIEQTINLDQNIHFINLELKEKYPTLYNTLRHQIDYMTMLCLLAKDCVRDEKDSDSNGDAIFFASVTDLLRRLDMSENNRKKICNKNALLQYVGLLNKLSDVEIPRDKLKKAKKIQHENEFRKRTNFYSIPSFTTETIELAVLRAEQWKDNAYTVKGASREMFFRKEGADVANWLYPQDTHITTKVKGELIISPRTTKLISDDHQTVIVKAIFDEIDFKGYCTEADLRDKLTGYSQDKIKRLMKINLPEILDKYDLLRVRANKQLKEQFGISKHANPFLLLKNNQ